MTENVDRFEAMTSHPEPAGNPPARILVVDDEPFNVDYLEQELECRGFLTESACNGLDALKLVAAQPPDLVLLDVMMPDLDGISALRILKNDPETRLIPVILMTALNAVEDRVRGIEAGADDFLSKPVDERELFARIQTALSLKRTIDEKVSELQSASDHLERYGRRVREVAVLAVEWQPLDPRLPAEAIEFLARRARDAAEAEVRSHGGVSAEGGTRLVAVFDGPDLGARTAAAVDAGLAVVALDPEGGADRFTASAAIGVGPASVGSIRGEQGGEQRWLYGAEGEPVDRAVELAHAAAATGVLVGADVALLLNERFQLEAAGNARFRVVGTRGTPPSERRMATILITDIVGSTKTAERLGDRAWVELLARHEQLTREQLALFGGVEIDTTGDGFLACFEAPAQGMRCAFALIEAIRQLGLSIRVGLHTGEVEQVDGRPRGIALHIATRIAARAGSGEILVSSTTRDLAAGSNLVFLSRGEHTLSGVAEPRLLYAVIEEPANAPPSDLEWQPASTGTYPAGLSAREVDVLRLVALGLTDAEVAERLFLSVRTVNAHLRSIYRKAGVHSRAAAGRFAEENGLL
jgi:DNA-binding NarL/FixJ family response regulator